MVVDDRLLGSETCLWLKLNRSCSLQGGFFAKARQTGGESM